MKVMLVDAPWPLARALAERSDLKVTLLSSPHAIQAATAQGVSLHGVPFSSRAKVDFRAIRNVYDAIKSQRPDVVHAFYGRPLANTVLATMRMPQPPPIVSYRGIERVPSLLDPSELIAYFHPRVAAHACESNAVLDAMVRGGAPRNKCTTIYNCAPLWVSGKRERFRLAEFQVPDDAFVVGTVATMRPVKGIDLLLQAAIECADLTQAFYVLIGPVHDARIPKLAEHPAIRDRVRLLGFQQQAAAIASGFDVFVMPSRTEALCRALLESMSQAVCPIVSDAGGMKEVVRHAIDGLVVHREDASAISRALRLLFHNRDIRQQMAESAQARIRAEFTAERMAERATWIYESLQRRQMNRRVA